MIKGNRKTLSFVASAVLAIAFCCLTTGMTFSQTFQNEYKPETTTKGITPMRAKALVGVALGLTSLVIAWRAKKDVAANMSNKGHIGAIVALLLGTMALVLSIAHLNIAAGAVFGSGSGKAGSVFALVLSLSGITLSGLALRQKEV